MTSGFNLYKKGLVKSGDTSFFEMVSGKDTETKQTKCLAYMLTHCPEFRKELLSQLQIWPKIKKHVNSCDYVRVDAEMFSVDRKHRRDITLTFYKLNQVKLVIVIEAKGLNAKANKVSIEKQLSKYLNKKNYPEFFDKPKVAIALTNKKILLKKNFLNLTWSEIIKILIETKNKIKNKKEKFILEFTLIEEFLKYIEGVNKKMFFYEKEVLSVGAADTHSAIVRHSIHSCPASYSYKDAMFITFRGKGGVMDRLYKIDEILTIDVSLPSFKTIVKKSYPIYADRIINYYEMVKKEKWANGNLRFYVLSEEETILLDHNPKYPGRQNHTYFKLSQLLDRSVSKF